MPRTSGPEPGGGPGRFVYSQKEWAAIRADLRLSPGQQQIVWAVFDDMEERRIAHMLGIKWNTEHSYLQRLYTKLRVHSRVQLVVEVVRQHERLFGNARGDAG